MNRASSFLRTGAAVVTGAAALISSYFASANCCERLNILATSGLMSPGCLGLSQWKVHFTALSLVALVATLALTFGSEASRERLPLFKTGAVAALASLAALLLFVVP